jgi:hypothetical protein
MRERVDGDPRHCRALSHIERAAYPDRSVMGWEPGSSSPPPGIAKLHEEIPFRYALRRGLVIVELGARVDPVHVDVLVFVGREFSLFDQPLDDSRRRLPLKVISFSRWWITLTVRGVCRRSSGLICTSRMSSVIVSWNSGNRARLPM